MPYCYWFLKYRVLYVFVTDFFVTLIFKMFKRKLISVFIFQSSNFHIFSTSNIKAVAAQLFHFDMMHRKHPTIFFKLKFGRSSHKLWLIKPVKIGICKLSIRKKVIFQNYLLFGIIRKFHKTLCSFFSYPLFVWTRQSKKCFFPKVLSICIPYMWHRKPNTQYE